MKIRAKIGMAGQGFSVGVGSVVDLPDALAQQLIDMGRAEAVADSGKKGKKRSVERAVDTRDVERRDA